MNLAHLRAQGTPEMRYTVNLRALGSNISRCAAIQVYSRASCPSRRCRHERMKGSRDGKVHEIIIINAPASHFLPPRQKLGTAPKLANQALG
jgi:uncharacterized OB-fold protein